jgi:CTP synthase (UTP-ammonia lyase)
VEYARNAGGIADAGHAEVDAAGTMVVVPLACSLAGEYRQVRAVPGTRAAAICGSAPMTGYHFCGYGLAAEMIPRLERSGWVISGYADDGTIEIVELPGHPFSWRPSFSRRSAVTTASSTRWCRHLRMPCSLAIREWRYRLPTSVCSTTGALK